MASHNEITMAAAFYQFFKYIFSFNQEINFKTFVFKVFRHILEHVVMSRMAEKYRYSIIGFHNP